MKDLKHTYDMNDLFFEKVSKRDLSLDVLRFLALTGIVIIHIDPQILWIREIRSFDVPLMIFLSGVSYSLSSSSKVNIDYVQYVYKRFLRLILPTWIFLCVYYLFMIIAFYGIKIFPPPNNFISSLIDNYTLMTGWYPWIMRLFFIIALFAPFVSKLISNLNRTRFLFGVVVSFLINELVINLIGTNYLQNNWRYIIEMNFPYVIVFCIGMYINRFSVRYVSIFMLISFAIYLALLLGLIWQTGNYVCLNLYKYPSPRLYYLSYGLTCTLLFWLFRNKICNFLKEIKLLNLCVFVGQHTLWFYLWHILFVVSSNKIINSAVLRFVFVYSGALLFVYLQYTIVKSLSTKIKNEQRKKKMLLIFNG